MERTQGRRSPGFARSGGRPGARGDSKTMRRPKRPFLRPKICRFCADHVIPIDYKERDALKRFLTEKGKIIPRRTTGNCAKHQRILVRSIKRARHAALLAFEEM